MDKFDFTPPPDTNALTGFRILTDDYEKIKRIAEIEEKAMKSITKGLLIFGLREFEKEHGSYFEDKTSKALAKIRKELEKTDE